MEQMDFAKFKDTFEKKPVIARKNHVPEKVMVSVCVQTCNHGKFIEKCLNSIITQKTSFKYEILLGDDASRDGTREICEKYAKRYPDKIRLFLHYLKNNIQIDGKSTGIFNFLFNYFSSSGDFIAYCDGDDFWDDEYKLQKQVDYLQRHPETVFTYHNIQVINKEGQKIKNRNFFEGIHRSFSPQELSQAIIQPPTNTWCFRKVIKEIPIEFTKSFNGDNFWISLLGHFGNGEYLEDIRPSYYRIHTDSMWSSLNKAHQLKSKYYTYLYLSKYYKRIKNTNLANYFFKRSKTYGRMLINRYLKDFKIKKLLIFSKKYLLTYYLRQITHIK